LLQSYHLILRCLKSAEVVLAFQNDLGLLEENMIGGRTPGHGTPGRSPFGFGTPGRRDPEMYNSPFRSPLAGLSFGGFSPMQNRGFSPTRSPGGLGGTGYSPTSPGQLRILSVLMLLGVLLHSLQAVFCSELALACGHQSVARSVYTASASSKANPA